MPAGEVNCRASGTTDETPGLRSIPLANRPLPTSGSPHAATHPLAERRKQVEGDAQALPVPMAVAPGRENGIARQAASGRSARGRGRNDLEGLRSHSARSCPGEAGRGGGGLGRFSARCAISRRTIAGRPAAADGTTLRASGPTALAPVPEKPVGEAVASGVSPPGARSPVAPLPAAPRPQTGRP